MRKYCMRRDSTYFLEIFNNFHNSFKAAFLQFSFFRTFNGLNSVLMNGNAYF